MNELEKCMAGEWYDCHNEIFLEYKDNARKLLKQYNSFSYSQKEEKTKVLNELLGGIGSNVSVGLPFICDYGRNIYIGSDVSVNILSNSSQRPSRILPRGASPYRILLAR